MKKIESQEQLRQFRMHPELLFSVIKAQAGTHEKALLEAVMNAVDAGATQCLIELDALGYTIEDNGKGFSSKQEIEDFFETFGTPHKEGDATYGKFRMGRGQLFAFSRTVWSSNEFSMDVCIKTRGLDYLLKEKQEHFNGCKIVGTWHEKMKSAEVINLKRELSVLIKYMQIPIFINGENVSCQAEKQKWDVKTEEAYIKISKTAGTLAVYNLGALVCHYPASKFGIGGIVVAKKQLTVNFARNDVLVSECKVWKKITLKLNELMGIEVSKKALLTDSERIAIVNNIISGNGYISQFMNKGLLTDVTGKKPSFNTLLKVKKLTIGSGVYKEQQKEEVVSKNEMSFVLDQSMLERFMVTTAEELVVRINELIDINNNYVKSLYNQENISGYYQSKKEKVEMIHGKFNPEIIPIKKLVNLLNTKFEIKEKKELSKQEKATLIALQKVSPQMAQIIHSYRYKTINKGKDYEDKIGWEEITDSCARKIFIGKSELASAWTDGKSYIAFNEKRVKNCVPGELIALMLHEYCHNESTNASHTHPTEFYEMFHDIMLSYYTSISKITRDLNVYLVKEFTKADIKCNNIEFDIELDDEISKALGKRKIETIEDYQVVDKELMN